MPSLRSHYMRAYGIIVVVLLVCIVPARKPPVYSQSLAPYGLGWDDSEATLEHVLTNCDHCVYRFAREEQVSRPPRSRWQDLLSLLEIRDDPRVMLDRLDGHSGGIPNTRRPRYYSWHAGVLETVRQLISYARLDVAQFPDDCDLIRAKVTSEWQDARNTLLIVATADAAGCAVSSGTDLEVTEAALRCLILSATTAAFGLCLLVGLNLRYLNADAQKFAVLARNRFDENYSYFAITSRLPLLALYLSVLTFSLFLLIVAYVAWPGAVLVLGTGGMALISLQYIAKGVELLVHKAYCWGSASYVVPLARRTHTH